MTRSLAISDTGLRLIKAFEGFRPEDRTLVTGVRVVGYGHRLDADDLSVSMDRDDAEEQLLDDLEPVELMINEEVHAPLTQGQYDALCSLVFNIGVERFRDSSILRALNNGRVLDAANGFDVWRRATVNGETFVVDALMRRRTAEKSLFLRHEPAVPASAVMLHPLADPSAPLGSTDDGLPRISEPNTVLDDLFELEADLAEEVDAPEAPEALTDEYEEDVTGEDFLAEIADDIEKTETLEDPEGVVVSVEPSEIEPAEVESVDVELTNLDPVETDLETPEPQPESTEDEHVELASEAEPDTTPSVITGAAESLAERLSALLDAETAEPSDPERTLAANDDAVRVSEIAVRPDDGADESDEDSPRSNLVSFPKRERVLEEDVTVDTPSEAADIPVEEVEPDPADASETPVIVKRIDDLAADDVIRAGQGEKPILFDPEGDPVENAMRYLEQRSTEEVTRSSEGSWLWVPILLGALLIGASAVFLGDGAAAMLAEWGPIAVSASAITGGGLLLFGLYALARAKMS